MRIITCVAILAIFTFPAVAHAQSAQDSEDTCARLFVAANYERAAIKCQLEADMGDTQSELLIGMLYQTGNAVTASASEAIKYLSRAAEKGNAFAAYRLALVYSDGTLMPKNFPKSREWLDIAVDGGSVGAMDLLGLMYWQGIGDLEKDLVRAFSLIEKAAELEAPMAMYHLGIMYSTGQGVPQDLGLAHNWIQRSADKGYAEAKTFLGSPLGRATAQSASGGGDELLSLSGAEITKLFESLHEIPLEDSATVIEALEGIMHTVPSYFIYEMARRKGWASLEEGAVWFWVGAIRLRYDVLRCVDSTAENGIRIVQQSAQDTLGEYFKTGAQRAPDIIEAAFLEEAKFPLETDPSWVCMRGARIMSSRRRGKEISMDKVVKPNAEWPALHDEALEVVRSELQK